MATNIAKLKPTTKGKGTPPKAEDAPDIIKADTRPTPSKTRPLQLKIEDAIFSEFSQLAGQEFGFEKGAKSRFFLRMFEYYKENHK